ncbi:MAG: RNA-dependent RNA polymerase [Hangzhou totivirus 7]|nr:MAG: RNA-dependent RNA polymerase [Hangzhou totivirus 7]
MQQTYKLKVPKSQKECDVCSEIIKTGMWRGYEDEWHLHSDFKQCRDKFKYMWDQFYERTDYVRCLGRPLLEGYVYYPHVCCFSTLRKVQSYKDGNWIERELFDKWMSINGGDYQLGLSGKLDELWFERHLVVRGGVASLKRARDLIDFNLLIGKPVEVFNCKWHARVEHVRLKHRKSVSRNDIKVLNSLFPFSSAADKKKTNVDLASIVVCALKEGLRDKVNRAMLLVPIGSANSIATALVIHAVGNAHFDRMADLIIGDKACCMEPVDFNKYLKCVTTALRRTSKWADGSVVTLDVVAGCAYWEMCIGRSIMKSDWEEERQHRLSDHLYLKLPLVEEASPSSNLAFISKFGCALDEIMRELVPCRMSYMTWVEFVESRQSWLSSGSSGGEHILIDEKEVRVNKRTYFESIPIQENISWLYGEPKLEAVASEKFEQSKARAIYGTKPKDYCVMAYAIMQLEAVLHKVSGLEGGLTGADEMRSILRRMKMFKEHELEGLMIDYADFNIQHTLEAQAEVFNAILRRFEYVGIKGDILIALKWCSDACLNQWVKFPGSTEYERVVQGLFSGNRGTNFINTLCNLAYFKCASDLVKKMLDISPVDLYNLHQGDDVWISFKNRLWGISLYATMKNMGFVFQNSKQLQDISRGEFLRVLYSREGAMGYLARAIGTLIIRPLQGEDDVSPDSRVTALNNQIMVLSRRMLSDVGSRIVWTATVRHACTSTLPSGDSVSIPLHVVYRSYLDGGLDVGPPKTMAEHAPQVAPIPTIQFESPDLFRAVPRHTTDAWIKVISSKFKSAIDAESLGTLLHRVNTSDSLRPIDKVRCLARLHKQIRHWLNSVRDAAPVNRNYAVWGAWLATPYVPNPLMWAAVSRQVTLYRVKHDINEERTRVDIIIAAIASSPFKDVASAERALHMGYVESARTAIRCSKNTNLASNALSIMGDIEARTSRDILARIMTGVRGVGNSFSCVLHPIILSWVNKVSLDLALVSAMNTGVTSIPEWDRMLFRWQEQGVRCLLSFAEFQAISKY